MNYLAILFTVAVLFQLEGKSPLATVPIEEENASAKRVFELAQKYEFFADATSKTKLSLEAKPLLTYSNPIRGDVHGNVFVWTHQGRPQVLAAIFDYRSAGWMDSEFHTLSSSTTVGVRDGVTFWHPNKSGIDFRPVPGSPAVGKSAGLRLTQMRSLARQYSVERQHPEQKKEVLRMLPQPIYRYSSAPEKVLDAAIFVFVEGTDPEAYLLVEATDGEAPTWQFAFARMNIVEFNGFHNGEPVWHVGPVSWETMFEKHEPYAIVRENPRRGLTRSP